MASMKIFRSEKELNETSLKCKMASISTTTLKLSDDWRSFEVPKIKPSLFPKCFEDGIGFKTAPFGCNNFNKLYEDEMQKMAVCDFTAFDKYEFHLPKTLLIETYERKVVESLISKLENERKNEAVISNDYLLNSKSTEMKESVSEEVAFLDVKKQKENSEFVQILGNNKCETEELSLAVEKKELWEYKVSSESEPFLLRAKLSDTLMTEDDLKLHLTDEGYPQLQSTDQNDTKLHSTDEHTKLHSTNQADLKLHSTDEDDIKLVSTDDDGTKLHSTDQKNLNLFLTDEDDTKSLYTDQEDLKLHQTVQDYLKLHFPDQHNSSLNSVDKDDPGLHSTEYDYPDLHLSDREDSDQISTIVTFLENIISDDTSHDGDCNDDCAICSNYDSLCSTDNLEGTEKKSSEEIDEDNMDSIIEDLSSVRDIMQKRERTRLDSGIDLNFDSDAKFSKRICNCNSCMICLAIMFERYYGWDSVDSNRAHTVSCVCCKKGVRRFGLLLNCQHSFCLECTLKLLKHGVMSAKNVRCPKCYIESLGGIPIGRWSDKQEKEILSKDYATELLELEVLFYPFTKVIWKKELNETKPNL